MKMRYLVTGVICLFLISGLQAQVRKGFDALYEYDFFRARKLFLKYQQKEPVAANYGLALVHVDRLNHFHSLDSAQKRILLAADAWKLLGENKKRRLLQFGVNDSSLGVLQKRICMEAFTQARELNTFESYTHYLTVYSGSQHQEEAETLRNKKAYELAKAEGSSSAYMHFITQYPHALEVPRAKERLDDAQFREETSGGTVAEYTRFIMRHPQSKHVEEAENQVYNLEVPRQTMEELYRFVKTYPANRNSASAWEILYLRFTADQRSERFAEFKEKYPEYPFQDRISRDFELSGTRLFPVVSDGKWGFADSLGHIVIPFQYAEVGHFSENLAPVKIEGKTAYLNKAGIRVIPPLFEEGYSFTNGIAIAENDSLSGLINTLGDWIIQPEWASVEGPFGRLYRLTNGAGICFYDSRSRIMLPDTFDETGEFSEGFCAVGRDGLFTYMNEEGRLLGEMHYQEAQAFQHGFAVVMQNSLYGLIDNTGKSVLACRYEGIGSVSEGLIKVYQNGKCAYFGTNGKIKIPFMANCAVSEAGFDGFSNGLTRIKRKGKTGFMDAKGKEVIKPIFEQAMDFSSGLAAFRKKDKWGYLDKSGKVAIPASFDVINGFKGAYAIVGKAGKFGIIDRNGKTVKAFDSENIQEVESFFIFSRGGMKMLSDYHFNSLLQEPCQDIRRYGPDEKVFELYQNGHLAYYHAGMKKIFWMEEGF